ncbi:MAG: helix-hairpin-helix domain-containing protein [Comamonadaceae bacterium]|nr:MAG: helix-hairpin-helix domain-containing protein [Comamonadaceae bacterium]
MKSSTVKIALIALALSLSTSLALAAESKPPVADAAKASAKPASTSSAPRVKLVDLNSAKKEELKSLPGVTDEVAAKIIAGRPYLSKAHLLTRKIVEAGEYENLRALVIAKQKGRPDAKPVKK